MITPTMRTMRLPLSMLFCFAILGATWLGCSSKPADVSQQEASQEAEAGDEAVAKQPDSEKPFQLGDLLKPFDPPPLEELDKTAEWIDRPVLDGMKLMRQKQAADGSPELSVKEALAVRNNSSKENEQIVDTLGRLANPEGEEVDLNQTFLRHASGDLKTTNPVLVSTSTDVEYQSLASVGLFSFDWNFEQFASSDTVRSWQTSKDGLLDKVIIRDDLTWSDGTPITAYDVEFTFQVIMSSTVPIPALRTAAKLMRWVKAYDDHTVMFFHKEPLATNVSSMEFSLLPKHIYADSLADDPTLARSQYHTHLEDDPVVGGPYILSKRIRGQEFVMQRRESYYMHQGKQVRDKPYFAEVRFKNIEDLNTALLALKAGKLHEQMILPDQWISQTDGDEFYRLNTKASGLSWTSYYIVWNQKTPFFEDPRVRWAMTYAIDYEEMLGTIFYDIFQASQGTYHPTSWMFPKDGPEPVKQDLDKAEQLLDEAGWTDTDGDGVRDKMINGRRVPFRFTLMCHQIDLLVRLNTLVKECLDQIGIDCTIKPTEFTVCVQKTREHQFQAYQGVWGTGADPDTSANIFVTDEGRNYGYYSNPQVDNLFAEARRELDRDKRAVIYGKIHNVLWEDQPFTWLLYRNSFYGFSKKLRGYNFSPRGPYSFSPGLSSIHMPAAQQ